MWHCTWCILVESEVKIQQNARRLCMGNKPLTHRDAHPSRSWLCRVATNLKISYGFIWGHREEILSQNSRMDLHGSMDLQVCGNLGNSAVGTSEKLVSFSLFWIDDCHPSWSMSCPFGVLHRKIDSSVHQFKHTHTHTAVDIWNNIL